MLTLNDHFDQIYCINLHKDSDKLANFARMASHHDFTFKRIEAYPPNHELVQKIWKKIPEGSYFKPDSGSRRDEGLPAIGCTLSHIAALTDATKNNYQRILILEDDVIPSSTFKSIMEEEFYFPKDWAFLYLGGNLDGRTHLLEEYNDVFSRSTGIGGTYAWAIKADYFKKCIKTIKNNIWQPIDKTLMKLHKLNKNNTFILNDPAFLPNVFESGIRKSNQMANSVEYLKRVLGNQKIKLDIRFLLENQKKDLLLYNEQEKAKNFMQQIKNSAKKNLGLRSCLWSLRFEMPEEIQSLNKTQLEKKISLPESTLIMPFRGDPDNPSRIKCLELTLDNLTKLLDVEIFIAEHNHKPTFDLDRARWPNVRYDFIKCPEEDPFNRTGTLNYLIKNANGKVIFNHDADLIIHPEAYYYAEKLLLGNHVDCVIPHNGLVWNYSHEFDNSKHMFLINSFSEIDKIRKEFYEGTIDYTKLNNEILNLHLEQAVGGVVALRKETYIRCGMENELIKSWGFEDLERLSRFTNLNLRIIGGGKRDNKIFSKFSIFHFDHDRATTNNGSGHEFLKQNKKIYETMYQASTDTTIKAINSWPWVKEAKEHNNVDN